MNEPRPRPESGRADRVLPGVWRLRLPCPWPGVPHVNAWAIRHDDGVVLFDTGIAGRDGSRHLELALAQAGFSLEDVRLLVCTHSHTDHYGLAAPIVERAGCELWMHPAWGHIRGMVENRDRALDRRIEVARQSGVPEAALRQYEESRRGDEPLVEGIVAPDRDLLPGVQVETDLGLWDVYETPGHAPSHVVLHQPGKKLLISGDHILGRVSLFFDYGHTPDPVGEFLAGLARIEDLDVGLCLAGHGRPFRDFGAKIEANRAAVDAQLTQVRESLGTEERTAFEVVRDLLGPENVNGPAVAWGLQMALAYLDHLAVLGEAALVEGSDPKRWRLHGE